MKQLLLLCAILGCTIGSWGQKKFDGTVFQQATSLLTGENDCAAEVYQFADNYFNRLLSITPQERLWRMAADNVIIEEGQLENLSLINSQTSLYMSMKDGRGILSIMNEDVPIICISFPMSYQLIKQKNQIELEKMLIKDLKTFTTGETAPKEVNRSRLMRTAPSLFVKKGNSYYLDAINNDLYYQEDTKQQLALVCSIDYLLESVSNILLEENANCRFTLDMSIHRYGFKTDSLQVDLNKWIAYCKDSGCELFVGIKKINTKSVCATVFAVNHCFNYNHVVNVDLPITVLENKKGTLKADTYIYIPTHNLSGLFEELNFVTKKRLK